MSTINGLHCSKIIVEGDLDVVIKWISEAFRVSQLHPLLHDISQLISQLQHFKVHHIFREANSSMEWLARRHTNFRPHWTLNFSSNFAHLIQNDALCYTYLHFM